MTALAASRNTSTTIDRLAPRRRPVARPLLYGALVLCALLTLLPFVWVLSGSLRSLDEIRSDPGAWLPHHITLDNFVRLFRTEGFGGFLVNSIVVAVIVVAGNIVAASAAGYALAKLDFAGKRIAFGAVMAALMVPFTTVFVTQFVITVDLGLADTLTGIALPGAALPLSVFIMRQYALSVPDELLEAARIDGASAWRSFRSITVPLLSPVLLFQTVTGVIASVQTIMPLLLAPDPTPAGITALPQSNYLYMMHVFAEYFAFGRYGYASALLWVLFVLILVATGLIFKATSGVVFYNVDPEAKK